MSFQWAMLVSCLTLLTRIDASSRDIHLDLKSELLEKAPAKWQEYTDKAKGLQGRHSFSLIVMEGASLSQTSEYVIKSNNGSKLILSSIRRTAHGKQQPPQFRVQGVNSHYSFVLGKPAHTDKWLLTTLGGASKGQLEEEEVGLRNAFLLLVKVDNDSLLDLAKSRGFQILSGREVLQEGERLVELTFKVEGQIERATVVLDPQRYWCLRSYDLWRNLKGRKSTLKLHVSEMGLVNDTLPVPKRATLHTEATFPDGSRTRGEWQFEYDLVIPQTLPAEREFYLSAFGLPEPVGVDPPGGNSRWYLWFIGAGVVSLAIGYYFRRRLRQREVARA
jgi:hypothetical protein